jgi:hypothetical protein
LQHDVAALLRARLFAAERSREVFGEIVCHD